MQKSPDVTRLLEIVAALRTPGTGCPWDLEQTFATIAPYTIEEAYEVADAIARGDLGDLKEELGDLLLQVVFHARIAEEKGAFDFGAVVESITDKLIRRHPHVFGALRGLSAEAGAGRFARRCSRGPPRSRSRRQASAQGHERRFRLERYAARSRQDTRRNR
jgi:nucleoside triphosphate diphosphatase